MIETMIIMIAILGFVGLLFIFNDAYLRKHKNGQKKHG